MAMLELGITPETSTPEDWQKAADYLQRFNDVRRHCGAGWTRRT